MENRLNETCMHGIKILFCCTAALMSLSCTRKSINSLERKGVTITTKRTEIGYGDKKLQIQYLGCGGLYIRHQGRSVIIDPYFSNQRIFNLAKSALLGGKIHSKPRKINFAKQRILDSLGIDAAVLKQETQGIFVAHGHYDHLMDVPYVFNHWFEEQPDIYANNSSFNTCFNAIDNHHKLHDAETIMSVGDQQGKSIDFTGADGSIMKVYPIRADHNPHAVNIKFFSGAVMCPLPHYEDPESKTRANDWLEGRTLSFLIDIEQQGSVVFRLFIQSSSTHYPDGMPPKALQDKRPVDLAILGVASYQFSETTYPCSFLEELKVKKVMYIHWEDFFRNYKRKPKSVTATDVPRFFSSIVAKCHRDYVMPAPGVVTTVNY